MKKSQKKSKFNLGIQLQIDFLLPADLTPTKDELDYELKEFGSYVSIVFD